MLTFTIWCHDEINWINALLFHWFKYNFSHHRKRNLLLKFPLNCIRAWSGNKWKSLTQSKNKIGKFLIDAKYYWVFIRYTYFVLGAGFWLYEFGGIEKACRWWGWYRITMRALTWLFKLWDFIFFPNLWCFFVWIKGNETCNIWWDVLFFSLVTIISGLRFNPFVIVKYYIFVFSSE